MNEEREVREALSHRTWAIVGCSPDPSRDSNGVTRYLENHGYRVIPVNPTVDEILGRACHPTLAAAAEESSIDVVDIFRRSEAAAGHIDEAIEIGAKAVWMQLGVIDELAAKRAEAAGLTVVMDRCPKIEIPRLGVEGPGAPVGR